MLKKFIKSFTTYEMRVLGRWNLEQSLTQLNGKIDMANEDHCGNCSQYIIMKQSSISSYNKSSDTYEYDEDEEIIRYMM